MVSDAAQINGTPYVQSKLAAYNAIKESSWAKKVITLFPTMVVGGGNNYPYSHISQGLKTIKKPIQWAKWLKLNGAFHFLHAKDIASMIVLSMTGQKMPSDIVMGNKVMSFNTAVIEIARHFNQKVWFQIPIPQWLISIIIFILGKLSVIFFLSRLVGFDSKYIILISLTFLNSWLSNHNNGLYTNSLPIY